MLLIGDIHITQKHGKKIVDAIKDIISQNPDEKNIIFLGDYVYHFNYDRKSLLELFDLFIELYMSGKNVYVLAGNHDRIKNRFVYEEAEKISNTLNNIKNNQNDKSGQKNTIRFITEPIELTIEDERCLFFPFNNSVRATQELKDDKWLLKLKDSKDLKENTSYNLNTRLKEDVDKIKKEMKEEGVENKKLIVFHHHYFEGIDFPGQRAKFKFSDIALSKEFLDDKDLFFVSGHLHSGFMNDNYLCTGSVWCASPLERNSFKFIYNLNIKEQKIKLFPLNINLYLTEQNKAGLFIDAKHIEEKQIEIIADNKKLFNSNSTIKTIEMGDGKIENKNTSLLIYDDSLEYEQLNTIIDEGLMLELADIRIKRYITHNTDAAMEMGFDDKDLLHSLSDWRELATEFISTKYADNKEKYFKVLADIGAL